VRKIFQSGIAATALIAATAPGFAADVPVKAALAKSPAPVFDWTGFYLGAYAGVGASWLNAYEATPGTPPSEIQHTGFGFTGGLTAGVNFQFGNWVAGVEGDIGLLDTGRRMVEWFGSFQYDSRTSRIATLRGRLGYSVGSTLNYITGGSAWMHVEDILTTPAITSGKSSNRTGFVVGSGIETMLGGNWSAKAEYLFVDVADAFVSSLGTTIHADKHRYHLMKFGANYRFGGKPQPALPAHDWSGIYAGVAVGTVAAHARGTDPSGTVAGEYPVSDAGFSAGLLAGFNWQVAPNFVAGVEGDFSFLDIDHASTNIASVDVLRIEAGSLATFRGRLGYNTGPALLYLTGGAAWVKVRDDWTRLGFASSSKILSGYTVGGGIEAVLANNWTTRIEYLYVDAGKGDTLTIANTIQLDHKFHLFRTALTYRFAGGAAAARN